mmetsp:Transcript_112788/g.364119  ORF Transcript_112788/g.364119 Transcript_112788/m.364119 type:complete len:443 (+) Transcript_112788:82-1410(+)
MASRPLAALCLAALHRGAVALSARAAARGGAEAGHERHGLDLWRGLQQQAPSLEMFCRPSTLSVGTVRYCKYNETQKCPVSRMPAGSSFMVFPGGRTRCISNDIPHYAFQVLPGSSDKLMLFFDGGGACWNKLTFDVGACDKQFVYPMPREGLLSSQDANPFANYTKVYVQYCTGDLHSGDVLQPYKDKAKRPVEQRGYHNTRSAVDWALANMAPELESLVLLGQSAGAIGTQVWASKLLREFKYKRASIIADSYAGVFPDGFQGPVFKTLGVCDLDILTAEMKAKCSAKNITISDAYDEAMKEFPNVAFANLQSKYDVEQIGFYQKAALSIGRFGDMQVSKDQFAQKIHDVLKRYSKNENYVSFLKPTQQHVYSICNKVFRTSANVDGAEHRLSDWLSQFNAADSRPIRSVCEDSKQDTVFCDVSLAQKTFTPKAHYQLRQ